MSKEMGGTFQLGCLSLLQIEWVGGLVTAALVKCKSSNNMDSTAKLAEIRRKLAKTGARLVAVSKTRSVQQIDQLYQAGQRIFGENRVQEMLEKQPVLPDDVEWHLIGHLQRNKVRFIAPFVSMIHSVDSERLIEEIDRQAQKTGRMIPVLLQVHIAQEETKFGWSVDELRQWIDCGALAQFAHVRVCGLMAMASFTENKDQVRAEFHSVSELFKDLRSGYFSEKPAFCELSMGMSGDWEIALEEGATLVRIGSALF